MNARLAHPSPHPAGDDIETEHFIVALDPKNGSIRRLRNKKSGREWASSERPLGAVFLSDAVAARTIPAFFDSYVVSNEDWAKKDFGKPNIERFGARSQEWTPALPIFKWTRTQTAITCLRASRSDDAEALRTGRAAFPQKMYLEMFLAKAEPTV